MRKLILGKIKGYTKDSRTGLVYSEGETFDFKVSKYGNVEYKILEAFISDDRVLLEYDKDGVWVERVYYVSQERP